MDYLATNSSVVWSATANAGYAYDIAGIGQDNLEGLNQKQSKSVNVGFQPAIGLGTVEASNDLNSSIFAADKSYMLWGSNGQPSSYALSYTPNSFTPVASFKIMNRVWKVQETGTVGVVAVTIPGSLTGVYLLVSNANNFSTTSAGVTEYAMIPDGAGNVVAQVNLNNGQYFTFGQDILAPGCVTAGLDFWFDPAVSVTKNLTAVTAWADRDGSGNNPLVTQATSSLIPTFSDGDAASNFNPYIDFKGNTRLNQRVAGSDYSITHTTFGVVNNYASKVDYTHFLRFSDADNSDGGTHVWGLGHANDNLDKVAIHYISAPFSVGTGGNAYNKYNLNRSIVIGQNTLYGALVDPSTPTSASAILTYNGNESLWTGTATPTSMVNHNYLTIGGGNAYGMNNNKTSELIHYSRALSQNERQRVNTYLGIKHGLTLEHNYLSGGSAVIYNVSSYSANVTGIGRDDCQGLQQKQSKSVLGTAKMTIGISGTVAALNATHPGSFSADKSFIVFGDNGQTGLTSLSATGSCPPPPSADKFTKLVYKVTETGNAEVAQLQFDAAGQGFNPNYPLYMQVASDAAFTNLLASVPMSLSGSIAKTNYNFPANSTSYVRFAGNTASPANICSAPKTQTFHFNKWYYGDKDKTIIANYGTSAAIGDMVMRTTITDGTTDPNVLLYKPTVDWWPVFDGLGLFIPRYDNNSVSQQGSVITTKMQFLAQATTGAANASTSVLAAQTVDFTLRDIDGYAGGLDVVKVYGKVGASVYYPKISRTKLFPTLDYSALTISGNTITAGFLPWDLTVLGNAYVSFDTPVEEVYVEYTKKNTYNFKVYNDLRIGAITTTCKLPTPKEPLADNVYIYKEVAPNPYKTNEKVTYKFTVQNTNCDNRVIDINDNLPGGLTWADSSFVTSANIGGINAYGNSQQLQVTSLTAVPGTSYIYVEAKGTTPGTYNNQADYVVNGNSYKSDDPSVAGTTAQPTPLTLIENDPDAGLSITKSVDKSTSPQNGTLTYTYQITNPNATSAVLTTFQDVLPGELTYVASTLTGAGSGTANAYGGASVLTIRNLTVPAGSSLTLTVSANVNSYTVGQVANNIAQVTPDVSSGFRIRTSTSNVASTTIVNVPPTVAIVSPANNSSAVVLNPTVSGTATPGATVVLTSSAGGGTLCTTTSTTTGTWSCPVNLSAGPQTLSAVATNAGGVSSPATAQITVVNTTVPLSTSAAPAQTATVGQTKSGNAYTDLQPTGGTAPYVYSNDTGNPSCSGVAGASQLPSGSNLAVNSSTGAYSYVAPATPGVYYFCIKVCDSSPTPVCVTRTYTLTVSPASSASGTLDCSSAQIMGIVQNTAGNGVLKLTMAVSTTGSFAVTVNGSGLSANPSPFIGSASSLGTQTFYVPLSYTGANFAPNTTITVADFGTCTVDMTLVTPKTVSTSVLNLGPACSPASAATLVK